MMNCRELPTVLMAAFLLGACGGEPPLDADAVAAEKCPKVHIDRLAGDWVRVQGASADGKVRMRIIEEGEGYRAYYVDEFFSYLELVGEKRPNDVAFVEVATGARKEAFDAHQVALTKLFVEASVRTCSLEVFNAQIDVKGGEVVNPKAMEFLEFPDMGVAFTYLPATESLFFNEAAAKRSVAEQQVVDRGGAAPEASAGTLAVGMFSKVADDGDASCTYDMDLYFDGKEQTDKKAIAAGEVEGEWRHWYYEWDAPYSGNHLFEMYRYRTCGGERVRIGIAANVAVMY